MLYSDKSLPCAECGSEFVYSASEQEHSAYLGLMSYPRRCPACRVMVKAVRAGGVDRWGGRRAGTRDLYPALCSWCGQPALIPFKPRGDRPVYCDGCYSSRR
jgi:CxxC-x17-CxxC domain-containing protein